MVAAMAVRWSVTLDSRAVIWMRGMGFPMLGIG